MALSKHRRSFRLPLTKAAEHGDIDLLAEETTRFTIRNLRLQRRPHCQRRYPLWLGGSACGHVPADFAAKPAPTGILPLPQTLGPGAAGIKEKGCSFS